MLQRLAPGVKNHGHTELGAEMPEDRPRRWRVSRPPCGTGSRRQWTCCSRPSMPRRAWDAADRKARAIVDDLRTARMNTAADLVERSVSEATHRRRLPRHPLAEDTHQQPTRDWVRKVCASFLASAQCFRFNACRRRSDSTDSASRLGGRRERRQSFVFGRAGPLPGAFFLPPVSEPAAGPAPASGHAAECLPETVRWHRVRLQNTFYGG